MRRQHISYKKPLPETLICPTCQQIMLNRATLRNHIRRAHLNLPHGTCSVCSAQIVSKKAWKKHNKKHNKQGKIIIQKVL